MRLGVTFALLAAATAPAQKAPRDETLAWFKRFDAETQRSLMRGIVRRVQLDPNPAIQRIVSMQREFKQRPLAPSLDYHRAAKWARGVAPKREIIRRGDARHAPLQKKYPARLLLPDLHKAVFYDWGSGKIVRREKPLTDVEQFENLYHGYPPGSDDALAQLLQKFDNDPRARGMARYLAHQYADLDAKVFAGITLYDAWYSGEMMDVPDVDSIPFERQILKTRKFKSPIPKGPQRTWLYGQIRDAAFLYRKYRTLREAAAAAFLRAEPAMDPVYAKLVPRFHYLFVTLDDNPDKVADVLRGIPDREQLIREVDKRLKGSSVEFEKRLTRKKHLSDMSAWLKDRAQLAVYQQRKKDRAK